MEQKIFNLSKHKLVNWINVKDLIEILKEYPDDVIVCCHGAHKFHIHAHDKAVSFDTECEPDWYGDITDDEIDSLFEESSKTSNVQISLFDSNNEALSPQEMSADGRDCENCDCHLSCLEKKSCPICCKCKKE